MMNFSYSKFLFSSLFIFVFSTSLLSQEIEEVVVTETKKEESLQDVAIAVRLLLQKTL